MVEFGDGFRLALEEAGRLLAGLGVGIGASLSADHFDGDLLLNAGIFGQLHLAHAPAAQQA